MEAAKKWATETRFNGYGQFSIYTPTGNLHATRTFRTEAERAAMIARHGIGRIFPNEI